MFYKTGPICRTILQGWKWGGSEHCHAVAELDNLHGTMAENGRELTENERRFVDEYLIDHNGTRAYIKAFGETLSNGQKRSYGGAATSASMLLKNPQVKSEIRAAEAYIAKRNRVTADRVVKELAAIAFARVGDVFDFTTDGLPRPKAGRDIPDAAQRSVQSIKHETRSIPQENGDPIEIVSVEYKFHPKLEALKKLYDHLGMARENELQNLLEALPDDLRKQVAEHLESATASPRGPEGGGQAYSKPVDESAPAPG